MATDSEIDHFGIFVKRKNYVLGYISALSRWKLESWTWNQTQMKHQLLKRSVSFLHFYWLHQTELKIKFPNHFNWLKKKIMPLVDPQLNVRGSSSNVETVTKPQFTLFGKSVYKLFANICLWSISLTKGKITLNMTTKICDFNWTSFFFM